jgi:hypothetical protein
MISGSSNKSSSGGGDGVGFLAFVDFAPGTSCTNFRFSFDASLNFEADNSGFGL